MAYIPGNRTTTRRQQADGCSVEGLGLDYALSEFVARHNNLRLGDLATRWVPQTYSLGFEPPIGDPAAVAAEDRVAARLPFMRVQNNEAQTLSTTPASYALFGQNTWRHKGHNVTVIDPVDVETDQYAWTTSMRFVRPVIVDDVFLVLDNSDVAATYDNNFQYSNPAATASPATQIVANAGDWVSDIVLQLQVDSDLDRNNAQLSDLVINFWDFRADGVKIRNYNTTRDNLSPNSIHLGPADGLCLWLRNLNVPLPEFAVLRWSLLLPWYDSTAYDVNNSWNVGGSERPWERQVYHAALTVLEPLR